MHSVPDRVINNNERDLILDFVAKLSNETEKTAVFLFASKPQCLACLKRICRKPANLQKAITLKDSLLCRAAEKKFEDKSVSFLTIDFLKEKRFIEYGGRNT